MKEYFKYLLLTVLIFPTLLFITLCISFMLSGFLPGDPVLAYLPNLYTVEQYNQMRNSLGLNDPIIMQFIRYSFNILTGNWGKSVSFSRPLVLELVAQKLPRTLDLLFIPLIVSLVLGYYIGKFSLKRKNSTNRVIQITSLAMLAMPIIIIGMGFRYIFKNSIFPVVGYKNIFNDDPPLVTGFRIIDSMLSGQYYLITDYISHLFLPWITMIFTLLPLIIFITRSYYLNKRTRPSLLFKYPVSSIIATITIGFGIIISLAMLVDVNFGFDGFGKLLISSIGLLDYWVINVYIFIFPLIFTFLVSGSTLILALYSYIKRDQPSGSYNNELKVEENNTSTQDNKFQHHRFKNIKTDLIVLGKYLLLKLRSPYTIIGLGITIFAIIVSFFPNLLTPYSFGDAIGVFPPPPFQPPSLDHPLGTTKFGQDVLARILYGIPSSLIPVLISVGIGLLGGLIIGIPFNLLKNRYKLSLNGIMTPLFMYPIMLAGIFGTLFGLIVIHLPYLWNSVLIYGIILIPIFSIIITIAKFNLVAIFKQLIPYIPLMVGFVFLMNSYAGFLGFYDYRFIQFGAEISTGSNSLFVAPWATFYPGLAIFILLLGFFLLYAGLRQTPEEVQDIQRIF